MKHFDPDQRYSATPGKPNLDKRSKFHLVYLIPALIFIITVLSGYWLKSQLGFNFFSGNTLSNYFPFNQLVPNKIIHNHQPGIIFNDSFDTFAIFGNWNPLWMKEQSRVVKSYDPKGIDNSHCLLIKSNSTESWSCTHKNYIQVNRGDTFTFTVTVKLLGDKLAAYAGVAAFDDKKNVASWKFFSEKIDVTGKWVTVERSFTVPKGVSFIMFKISGIGVGEYRFDNVIFSKE